jgi:hypothetical protein
MKAEKVVAVLLTADAGVAALTGGRVFGGVAPQGSQRPYVSFIHESSAPLNAQRVTQLNTWRSQVWVLSVAKTYQAMKELGDAVINALAFKSGAIAGVQVSSILCTELGRDLYEPEPGEFGQYVFFQIDYQE